MHATAADERAGSQNTFQPSRDPSTGWRCHSAAAPAVPSSTRMPAGLQEHSSRVHLQASRRRKLPRCTTRVQGQTWAAVSRSTLGCIIRIHACRRYYIKNCLLWHGAFVKTFTRVNCVPTFNTFQPSRDPNYLLAGWHRRRRQKGTNQYYRISARLNSFKRVEGHVSAANINADNE